MMMNENNQKYLQQDDEYDDDSSHMTHDDDDDDLDDDDLDRKPAAKSLSVPFYTKRNISLPQQQQQQKLSIDGTTTSFVTSNQENINGQKKLLRDESRKNDENSKNHFDETFQMKKAAGSSLKTNYNSQSHQMIPPATQVRSISGNSATELSPSSPRATRRSRNKLGSSKKGSKKGLQTHLSSSTPGAVHLSPGAVPVLASPRASRRSRNKPGDFQDGSKMGLQQSNVPSSPGAFHSSPRASNQTHQKFSNLRRQSKQEQEKATTPTLPPPPLTNPTKSRQNRDSKLQQYQSPVEHASNCTSDTSSPGAVTVDGPGMDDGNVLDEYYTPHIHDEAYSSHESIDGLSADTIESEIFTHYTESGIPRQQENHSSIDNLPTASVVDDAETILYAEQVKREVYLKPNQLSIVLFGLLACAAVLTSRFLLFHNHNESIVVGDPRCWEPIESQSAAMQCHCTGTAEAAANGLTVGQRRVNKLLIDILIDAHVLDPNTTEIRLGACDPMNQALTHLASCKANNPDLSHLNIDTAPPDNYISIYVLTMLYVTMGGIDWTITDGWFDTINLCHWHGVNCGFLNVVSDISLSRNGLKGTIPSTIQEFVHVESIDFSYNDGITGTIPSGIGKIRSLITLDLSGLQLVGTIPTELGSIPRLRSLTLENNQLTGNIPSEIFTNSITTIDLSSNRLNGTIQFPNIFYNNNNNNHNNNHNKKLNLQKFNVGNNSLSGTLPLELGLLSSLNLINLSFNRFTGDIPSILGNLLVLEHISLFQSGFIGTIPETYCTTNINTIDVSSQYENVYHDDFTIDFRTIFLYCGNMEYCSCCSDKFYSEQPFVRILCSETIPTESIGI